MKNNLTHYLRLLLSLGLLIYLLSTIDLDETLGIFRKVNLLVLSFGFILLLLDLVINSYLIKILAAIKRRTYPLHKFVEMYLISCFWGTFLPSSLGTDAALTYSLSRKYRSIVDALSSIVVLRLFTSLPLFIFAFIGSIFIYFWFDKSLPLLFSIMGVCIMYFILFFMIVNTYLINKAEGFLERFKTYRIVQKVVEFKESYLEIRKSRVIPKLLFFSFLSKIASIAMVFVTALSLGNRIPMLYFFVFVPAIIVLTMLPISISGIGVREVSFAYFFSHVGVSNEQAVSISLTVFLLILIGNLGGGLLILKENLIVRRG